MNTGASLILLALALSATGEPFRPPAVPLGTHDPYFRIWSPADKLADADTVHWTGKPHRLTSLVRIDGKTFRLMGKDPANVPALPQTGLEVLPTRTIYQFEGEGVRLTLTFLTPALPDNLEVLARPLTYVVWTVRSLNEQGHRVKLYFDASCEIAFNSSAEIASHARCDSENLLGLRVGSPSQPVLRKKGDDLRIDWGYFYAVAPRNVGTKSGAAFRLYSPSVIERNSAPGEGILDFVEDSSAGAWVLAFTFDLGSVEDRPISRWLMLAYDDEFSIKYFKQNLRPYWRRQGDDAPRCSRKPLPTTSPCRNVAPPSTNNSWPTSVKSAASSMPNSARWLTVRPSPAIRSSPTPTANRSCFPRKTSRTAASAPSTCSFPRRRSSSCSAPR